MILCEPGSKVGVVSPQALERMKQEVETEHSGRQINVESMQLNLSSFRSTKEFLDAFKAKNLPLHLLINNAGVAWLQQLSKEPMCTCLCAPLDLTLWQSATIVCRAVLCCCWPIVARPYCIVCLLMDD